MKLESLDIGLITCKTEKTEEEDREVSEDGHQLFKFGAGDRGDWVQCPMIDEATREEKRFSNEMFFLLLPSHSLSIVSLVSIAFRVWRIESRAHLVFAI